MLNFVIYLHFFEVTVCIFTNSSVYIVVILCIYNAPGKSFRGFGIFVHMLVSYVYIFKLVDLLKRIYAFTQLYFNISVFNIT